MINNIEKDIRDSLALFGNKGITAKWNRVSNVISMSNIISSLYFHVLIWKRKKEKEKDILFKISFARIMFLLIFKVIYSMISFLSHTFHSFFFLLISFIIVVFILLLSSHLIDIGTEDFGTEPYKVSLKIMREYKDAVGKELPKAQKRFLSFFLSVLFSSIIIIIERYLLILVIPSLFKIVFFFFSLFQFISFIIISFFVLNTTIN